MDIDNESLKFSCLWRYRLLLPEDFSVAVAREWLLDNFGEHGFEISVVRASASNAPPGFTWGRYIGFRNESHAARFKMFWC